MAGITAHQLRIIGCDMQIEEMKSTFSCACCHLSTLQRLSKMTLECIPGLSYAVPPVAFQPQGLPEFLSLHAIIQSALPPAAR